MENDTQMDDGLAKVSSATELNVREIKYYEELKQLDVDIEGCLKRIEDLVGVKESDTGLARFELWDLGADKVALGREPPLHVSSLRMKVLFKSSSFRSPASPRYSKRRARTRATSSTSRARRSTSWSSELRTRTTSRMECASASSTTSTR